jgi:hypothetical protein
MVRKKLWFVKVQLVLSLVLAQMQMLGGLRALGTYDHGLGIAFIIIGAWGSLWCIIPLRVIAKGKPHFPRAGMVGGTWTEHRDVDMCGQGDVEIIHNWSASKSIDDLKMICEREGYSGFTVSSGVPSFAHAALKSFDFQLEPNHCKHISTCCHHPCTIYIYKPPGAELVDNGGPYGEAQVAPLQQQSNETVMVVGMLPPVASATMLPVASLAMPAQAAEIAGGFGEVGRAMNFCPRCGVTLGEAAQNNFCSSCGERLR